MPFEASATAILPLPEYSVVRLTVERVIEFAGITAGFFPYSYSFSFWLPLQLHEKINYRESSTFTPVTEAKSSAGIKAVCDGTFLAAPGKVTLTKTSSSL